MDANTACRLTIICGDDNTGNPLLSRLRRAALNIQVSALTWPSPLTPKSTSADLVLIIESAGVPVFDILEKAKQSAFPVPLVIAGADNSSLDSNACLTQGARDILPLHDQDRLVQVICQLLQFQREHRQRQQLELQLSCMEKRQLSLIDSTPNPIALVTADTHLHCNKAYATLFGREMPRLSSMAPTELLAAKDFGMTRELLRGKAGKPRRLSVNAATSNSSDELVLSALPASFHGQPCWQLEYHAPAGNREYAREKLDIAGKDLLTRLDNQAAFMARVETAIASAIKNNITSTLMVTRINHFRELRESLGLAATNRVLYDITSFLKQAIDKPYTASRLAQDEFGLLLFASAPDECLPLAEFIRNKVNNSMGNDRASPVNISTTVGIVAINDHALDAEDMIHRARINTGTVQGLDGEDSDTEKILRRALDEKLFSLRFQPMLSLCDDSSQWHEAQVRLQVNDQHVMSPDSFLPRANICNLAEAVDRQVLTAVLANAEFRQNPDLRIYVHISSNSLVNRTLLSWLARRIQKAPDIACRLIFQISELDLQADREAVQAFCRGLDELGIGKVISRFGCAMEPLPAVEAVRPCAVKLDEALIRDILYSRQQLQSVRKLINALHHKSVKVAVTGIGDPDMLPALWELDCDFVQGSCLQPPAEDLRFAFPMETELRSCPW